MTVRRVPSSGRGYLLHVPRPTAHAFEALEPSRMLVIVAPGGFHERYFEEGWEIIDDIRNPPPPREPDSARLRAALQTAGLGMVTANPNDEQPG
jgi:hypothetical protein